MIWSYVQNLTIKDDEEEEEVENIPVFVVDFVELLKTNVRWTHSRMGISKRESEPRSGLDCVVARKASLFVVGRNHAEGVLYNYELYFLCWINILLQL